MPETLAQKVKAKFPGVYDDLDDATLEAKVIAKYPGVYDDLPRTSAEAAPQAQPSANRPPSGPSASQKALLSGMMPFVPPDVAIGAAKGVGNTLFGAAKIVHDYTPVGRLSDAIAPGAFDQRPAMLEPSNTAQRIGYTGEQVGEFFIPGAAATKVGKAVNVAKDAALTLAQTGDPATAGISGALSAVIPGGQAVGKLATGLKESALETMAGSLKATKEWAKAESARLAPEMLKRGVGGSIKALRAQSSKMAEQVGKNLNQAYRAAAAAGETVPGDIIQGNIQLASDSLHTVGAKGTRIIVPGNEAAIAQLGTLEQFVGNLKPDIPVDQAAAIKQQFDDIVERAGLFGPKAMASASEKAQGWSFKKASDSFRQLLNTNPTIADLNDEASFWIGLRNVVNATKLRKVGQTGGAFAAGSGIGGAIIGGTTGDITGNRAVDAVIGGVAGRQLVRMLQSPAYMNKVSAPLKNALADALASGSQGRIASVASRILASVPAQAGAQ